MRWLTTKILNKMAHLFCGVSKRTLREISSAATAAAFWRSERNENCIKPHPPDDGFGSCDSGATSLSSFCLLSDWVLSSIFFLFGGDSNERFSGIGERNVNWVVGLLFLTLWYFDLLCVLSFWIWVEDATVLAEQCQMSFSSF